MPLKFSRIGIALAFSCALGVVKAEGTLKLYNWESYTSAQMIEKFEKEHNVAVELIEYESSDVALAKVRDQTVAADVAVVAGNYLPLWIAEDLVLAAHPSQLENFRNLVAQWVDPPFDPGRKFSVPWAWGVVGVAIHTDVYKGDIDTWSVVIDPPKELQGTINIGADMNEVIYAAVRYHGGMMCDADPQLLRQVRDTLVKARPAWASMEYGSVQKMATGHFKASIDWNGAALRQRMINPTIRFGLPREGTQIFSDNVVILKHSPNVANAKLFMNFIMEPRNAALNSAFHGYASAVAGAEQFLPASMREAPELNIPAEVLRKAQFTFACPANVQAQYAAIWTELSP